MYQDTLNLNHIKLLINRINISAISILKVLFKNKCSKITFTTNSAKYSFMALNGTLSNTDYCKYFIPYFFKKTKIKKYYPAIKSELNLTRLKCSLDLKND